MIFRDADAVMKVLYWIFLATLIVLFVGWAMAAWYPMPTWETEYPNVERYVGTAVPPLPDELKLLSPAQQRAKFEQYRAEVARRKALEDGNEKRERALGKKVERHNRAVALTALVISVVIVGFGIGLSRPLPVIAEGLLLGGLFTLIYSIGWSFVASPKVAVIPVGVGLVITIYLGYRRFVRTHPGPT
jgi:hypothetical protein